MVHHDISKYHTKEVSAGCYACDGYQTFGQNSSIFLLRSFQHSLCISVTKRMAVFILITLSSSWKKVKRYNSSNVQYVFESELCKNVLTWPSWFGVKFSPISIHFITHTAEFLLQIITKLAPYIMSYIL